MTSILHIATTAEWEAAQRRGDYLTASLESEGFIHCSTPKQAIPTANTLFRGQLGLLLLVIDVERLTSDLRYEPPMAATHDGDEQLFPYVYGPLNLDAVIAFEPLAPGPDGSFAWPFD